MPATTLANTAGIDTSRILNLPWYQAAYGGAGGAPAGTTTPAGALAPAGTQSGAGAYGAVPTVPSPQATQGAAIAGNIAAVPDLTKMATQVNREAQRELDWNYQYSLPGYLPMIRQSSQNILSNLRGELSPDVIRQMQTQAAERGVATGAPGSPNVGAEYLRNLGLTSLDLQNLAQGQLTGAIQRTPVAPQLNLANYLVTPEQQFQAQSGANIYAAAPNPAQAAAAAQAAARQGLAAGLATGGGGGGALTVPGGSGYDIASGILSRYGGTPEMPVLSSLATGYNYSGGGGGLPVNYQPGGESYYDYGSGIDWGAPGAAAGTDYYGG